jgi:beta-glucanase (GH16 family)
MFGGLLIFGVLAIPPVIAANGPTSEIQTLFVDDFSAPLSPNDWDYNHFSPVNNPSFYGRTQQRQNLPPVSDGQLHLELDTFNPTGFSFYGSEAITRRTFAPTDRNGIAFEVSARIATPVAGIVGGIFEYNFNTETGLDNELDTELLGNDAVAGRNRVQTNVYSDELLGAGHAQFVPVIDVTQFHIYRMEWFLDRVRWFVDNNLVREDTAHIPQGALALHLNIWAPNAQFADAYSASLQPTSNPAANTSYFVDISSARVAQLEIYSSPLVASVLPSSRSVQVGKPATAFATIINSSTTTTNNCAISPTTMVPASFAYQTTNVGTNAVTGTLNTPVNIPPGAAQSFVIAFTPSAPFGSTNIVLGFTCNNVNPVVTIPGVNTLLLSASTSQVADLVALAATLQNDGILHVTGSPQQGAFAVAIINLGSSASITATADTGGTDLPLTINLCQTDPTSGQCISAIGDTVTTTVDPNATPTFGIFVSANDSVPFVPQTNRVFVKFTDPGGFVRGLTSVAVATNAYVIRNDVTHGVSPAPASPAITGNDASGYGLSDSVTNGASTAPASPAVAGNDVSGRSLILNFDPPHPSISASTPLGSLVAVIIPSWSDGSPFTGTLSFGPPYSDDNAAFAISGNTLIVNPAGRGISVYAQTVQNVTILATD